VRIEVRRYATLADTRSGRVPGDPEDVTLDDGATVAQLLDRLALPHAAVHLAIVNGRIVHDRRACLAGGDRVALFPPVGGG